jgi:hypothetical protein
MIPTNPINAAAVAHPEMHRERVVQNVLVAWLKFYFSGNPFNTRGSDQSLLSITFPACDVGAEEMVLPSPLEKPFIHYYHLSQTEMTHALSQHDLYVESHRIMVDVTVPVSLPASLDGVLPLQYARRVGDHLAWLFRSDERAALSQAGIMRLKIVKPPTLSHAPDGMFRRSMVVDFEHHSQVDRPREI